MKFKYIFLSLLFLGLTNCETDVENPNDVYPRPFVEVDSGDADFSTYVAMGEGITAGMTDNSLFIAGQANSYPNIMAGVMSMADGGEFTQPYVSDNVGGILIGGTEFWGERLYFDGAGPAGVSGNISLSGDVNKTSGNLTVDVAGDINLDADGGDIRLYDGGVLYGNLAGGTGNFHIKNPTQDKDIVFTGNDGGSTFTALTLDMSDAGAAIFNQALYIPHYIYHTGDTNTYFGFNAH